LVFLLSSDIKNSIGVLAPLGLFEVPDFLNGVEFTNLRRKELVNEPSAINGIDA
jgi:hypothetical protein